VEARGALQTSEAANVDETGWMEAKGKAWLWGAVAKTLSVFLIHRRRSAEAFHALMGPAYAGAIGTDRWASYHGHKDAKRGFCWAHLKREFKALKELGHKGASRIGNAGLRAEVAVTKAYRRYLLGEIAHSSLKPMLQEERTRLEEVLRWGSSSTEPKAGALCRDVLKRYGCLWTFTRIKGIEPTNNRAERSLRKAVLWRKGSFGSDSPEGSRFAERMLTVSESLRAQGRSVLDFVEEAIRAQLTGAPHPSLLPVDSS
jgi:transposase